VKFSDDIRNLIKQGVSINEIHRRLGAAKSTIYYQYKRIKGKTTKPIIFNFKNENELGEFLGIFAGDGHCRIRNDYHYIIQIVSGAYETGYRKYLGKKLQQWFSKKPYVTCHMFRGKPSSYVFQYYSREIYQLIKKYLEWEGKKNIQCATQKS
jgi:hypothetical protein